MYTLIPLYIVLSGKGSRDGFKGTKRKDDTFIRVEVLVGNNPHEMTH